MSSLADRLKAPRKKFRHYLWEMHEYQDSAIEFMKKTPFSALFIDTGLGKTIICLTLIVWLLLTGKTKKVLVVAPVRVAAQTWPSEVADWDHLENLGYTVIRAEDDDPEVISAYKAALFAARLDPKIHADARRYKKGLLELGDTREGAEASRKAYIARKAASRAGKAATARKEKLRHKRRLSKAPVHIINIEQLEWLIDQYTVWRTKRGKPKRQIVDWPYDTVILDESSKFKDHSIARFQALAAVVVQGHITRLHELTATPAAESYMGLFAQLFLLDRGERLGKNITAYRNSYFQYFPYARSYKLLPGSEDRISDKISDICLVMKSGDYLDEQEPLFLDRKIQMTEAEAKQYKHFENNFILTLDDGEQIEAETAGALSGKLLQLASGAIYTKDGSTRVIHDHKIQDLAELVEELQGSPIMVAYWYKSSLARLRKAFPFATVMDETGKCVKPWNEGKIKMLLVHPAGVGHGLNMQYGPAHHIYFFDMCWSYELFYQLYRRLHRQGQTRRITVWLAQMVGTKDELVAARLTQKKDAQEILFEWIKSVWRRMKKRRNEELMYG